MSQQPRSHFVPRTREGRIATAGFVVLFLLAMPPFTHVILDQPDVWIGGAPLLFRGLLAIYAALIGVLLWAWNKGV